MAHLSVARSTGINTEVTHDSSDAGFRARGGHKPRLTAVAYEKLPADFSPLEIAVSVPKGSMRAASQHEWLALIDAAGDFTHLRADTMRSLRAVAQQIAYTANYRTMASMPTWERIQELTGLSRSTVARRIADLKAAGFLGVILTGSTPQTRPLALAHIEHNLSSIYVLAKPSTLSLTPIVEEHVNEHDTPTLSLRSKETLTCACACACVNTLDDALRATTSKGASRLTSRCQECRTGCDDVRSESKKRRDKRLVAAWEVKSKFAFVTDSSLRALAWVIGPYLDRGWSVSDIRQAIDTRPDGSKWEHSGMQGVKNSAHWLKYRLTAWLDHEGGVMPSFGQQEAAAASHRAALERARRERAEKERASRATPEQIRAIRERAATVSSLSDRLRERERELGVTATPRGVGGKPVLSVVRDVGDGECVHGETTALLPNGTPRCPLCRNKKNREL